MRVNDLIDRVDALAEPKETRAHETDKRWGTLGPENEFKSEPILY